MAQGSLQFFSLELDRRELRDAARLALQSAVAAALMFSAAQAAGLPEKFVGVLSAVLVVQPSVGNTLAKGWERIAATLIGIIIGLLSLFLLPSGYGTAVALGVSMLVMNAVAAFKPSWRYGVVAAVALALGSDSDVIQTALDRTISIGVGVTVGILVSFLVWPDKAKNRAERFLREALRAAATCLDRTLDGNGCGSAAHRQYLNSISQAREEARNARLGDDDTLDQKMDAVERFYQAVVILDRIPKQAGVIADDEFEERMRYIYQQARHLASDIADRTDCTRSRPKKIHAALEHLREAAAGHDGDMKAHEYRNALVFGLDEIQQSADQLVELFS